MRQRGREREWREERNPNTRNYIITHTLRMDVRSLWCYVRYIEMQPTMPKDGETCKKK